MSCRAAVSLLVLFLMASWSAVAADWPQYRGPKEDGFAPEKGINKDWKTKPPKELWRITLDDEGYAGPSVAAGKLYIIDHKGADDVVRAVDVANGKEVWSFPYPGASRPNHGFTSSTPAFDNGKLYTLGRMGNLFCLDAEKGAKIWTRNIKTDFHGKSGGWDYAASPLVDGDKLIVCPGGATASVVALDKNTGKELWHGGSDQAGYATPVIATIEGKRQYLVFAGDGLMSLTADNGALLWQFPWKTEYDVNAAAPIVINSVVFVTSGYGHGCGLINAAGGKPSAMWTNKEIQSHFSSAVLSDEHIYGTSDPGNLVCLNPKDGKAVWKQPGFEKGGLVAVDGVLIVMNGAGGDAVMVNMTPAGYQELGRCKPLDGQSWTAPIVADGKLYIRNTKALVCLDLK